MPGTSLSSEEVRLAKDWYVNEGLAPSAIALRLKRNKSTLTRILYAKGARKQRGRGRKQILSAAQVDVLVDKLKEMIKKANGKHEVTMYMLKRSTRCKASERTIRDRLHERDIYFYGMREKPALTEQDVIDRYQFGWDYMDKPRSWWGTQIHMVIDVKFFPVYLTGKARRHVAQSGCRGVYRVAGEGLAAGYYKPNPKLKYNTGAKGVHILAGVGLGKVLLWEQIQGRWNGAEAARIYAGPMLKALKAAYPGLHRFRVLEDNDPTGFYSRVGVAAKVDAKIDPFKIPKHSPQLNLCDYFLWAMVNKGMRAKEREWPEDYREDRAAYLRRLTRTAKRIPTDMIEDAMGSMKKRCMRLVDAEGGQIEG